MANSARGCYWQVQVASLATKAIFSLSFGDMVYSTYKKQRIIYHKFKGLKAPTIAKILVDEEGLCVTRQGVLSVLKQNHETRTIGRWPGNGRPTVISEDVKKTVEVQMQASFQF